jgi:hypothetical protein
MLKLLTIAVFCVILNTDNSQESREMARLAYQWSAVAHRIRKNRMLRCAGLRNLPSKLCHRSGSEPWIRGLYLQHGAYLPAVLL